MKNYITYQGHAHGACSFDLFDKHIDRDRTIQGQILLWYLYK